MCVPLAGADSMVTRPSNNRTALADALQSESLFGHAVHVETDSPIADVDVNAVVALPERHVNSIAAAVPAGVLQRLLDDAEDRAFQRRRQPLAGHVVVELDFRPAFLAVLADEVFDGLDDPRFVEHRRPQAADQPPGLVDGLADELGGGIEAFPCLVRVAGERFAKGLQPEQAPVSCWAKPSWIS